MANQTPPSLQQTPTRSLRNWLIFVFFLFIIVGAMAWWYLNNPGNTGSNGNFTQKKTSQVKEDRFAGWKTYTLSPITFRYPPTWTIANPSATSVGVSEHTLKSNSEDVATVTFNISAISDLDYKHLGVNSLPDFLSKYSQGDAAQVLNYKSGKVGELSGYSATLNGFTALDAWYATLTDGRILEISSPAQQDATTAKVVSSVKYSQ